VSIATDQSAARDATTKTNDQTRQWSADRKHDRHASSSANQDDDAFAAQERWERLARQGKWMIAVYASSESTLSDVVRLKRAHLNDKLKVRIEAQSGRIILDQETQKLAMEDRCVLDVPEERILWYEIIDEIGPDEVSRFRAAIDRGAQVSRDINRRLACRN